MRKITFVLIFLLLVNSTVFAYADYINPSREELEKMITEIAQKRGVPSVIVMALARVESVYRHYDEASRSVRTSYAGSIGLMQINNSRSLYDDYRLRYDIAYNIEAGIDVLMEKWGASASTSKWAYLPSVGDMDPNVLENWYFALWGYNGFVASNNPNVAYAAGKTYTFQDLVHMVIRNEYNQPINPIDISYLPDIGTPSRTLNVPTPSESHLGDLILAGIGDKVQVSFMATTSGLNLREQPDGEIIAALNDGGTYTVGQEAVMKGGYYWYYLLSENGEGLGWAARNWLVKIDEPEETELENKTNETGDIENDNSMDSTNTTGFTDIDNHWAREYILELYADGIIKGKTENSFSPQDNVTRQEFAVLLDRSFEFGDASARSFGDKNMIQSYAVNAVEKMIYFNIMNLEEDRFNPDRPLTRIEAALAISGILEYPDQIDTFLFEDVQTLSLEELMGLASVFTYEIITGRDEKTFDPYAPITRGEISKILMITRFHQN
ncbi:MAG: S-layer homology domain-containing protein [Eubacteriales bacterium]|nr:S-layer homology domain-containing protein [Eubacteriales bacterium]